MVARTPHVASASGPPAVPPPHHRDGTVGLGRVAGIPVRADWSLLVIASLLSWTLASGVFPELVPDVSSVGAWATAVGTTVVFLASLFAHELSHSVVARRYGIRVESVTLWMLGGIAALRDEPADPDAQLRIALAGPIASGALAILFFGVAQSIDAAGLPELVVVAAVWLASVNLVLALFNLVPAAPLDGGRVLHAVLWKRRDDRMSAGMSAAHAGLTFAYALIGLGFLQLVMGATVGGIWFLFLGWFVWRSARTEELGFRIRLDLDGVRVGDVMTPHPVVVDAALSVADVLDDYILRSPVSTFPVVERDGTVTGLITLGRIRAVPHAARADVSAAEAAAPMSEVGTAAPSDALVTALAMDLSGGDGRLLVFEHGLLVGIVSPTDIDRVVRQVELRRAYRARPGPARHDLPESRSATGRPGGGP